MNNENQNPNPDDAINIHIGAETVKTEEVKVVKKQGGIDGINLWIEDHLTKITIKDLAVFYRMISTLINAGISLTKGLEIITEQVENPRFRRIIEKLAHDVNAGKSLSEAMGQFPQQFPNDARGMIESGEISGKLNTVTDQLAIQTENSEKLIKKIKGAMTYPKVIMGVVAAVIGTVMTLVIPKLSELFTSSGKELPAMTKVLISGSDFMTTTTLGIPNIILLIIAFFAGKKIFSIFIRTPFGKYWWHSIILKLPIAGTIIKKVILAKFARNLSNLLTSGISITKTLRIDAEAVGNEIYREKILLVADDVERGLQIHQSIEGSKLFPPLVIHMIAIGEKIAQLDKLTQKIAEFYEDEVDETMENMSKIMEPLILLIVGGLVGTIAIAIMQPIMQISDVASNQ